MEKKKNVCAPTMVWTNGAASQHGNMKEDEEEDRTLRIFPIFMSFKGKNYSG